MKNRLLILAATIFTFANLGAGTMARFRTPVGDIDVELFDDDKPITVRNFLNYVRQGRYLDSIIHRWVPNFVIQGGGFLVKDRGTTNALFDFVQTSEPILNEYSKGKTYSNTYGTIAMARQGGNTNSATSQWFFNLKNNSGLDDVDGGFTVFGRVVRGTNVLNLFVPAPPANKIFRADAGSPLNELPVLSSRPTFSDLLFFDVTLLEVSVARAPSGLAEISWNCESNLVHHVEFTTNFPPVWTVLVKTNGTGTRVSITDPVRDLHRFYRVRAEP